MNEAKELDYLELLEQKRANVEPTYKVAVPSGFTFTLRRPSLSTYLASGEIPSGLLERMFADTPTSQPATLQTPAEKAASIRFMGSVVRDAIVFPRLVDNPQAKGEIRFEQLDDEDFLFIWKWVRSGGTEAEGLRQFRGEPEKAVSNSNAPKKHRKAR